MKAQLKSVILWGGRNIVNIYQFLPLQTWRQTQSFRHLWLLVSDSLDSNLKVSLEGVSLEKVVVYKTEVV